MHLFCRNFHLYVKQKKVVSDDFVATFVGSDGIKAPLDIDTWNFYTGTLKGKISIDMIKDKEPLNDFM